MDEHEETPNELLQQWNRHLWVRAWLHYRASQTLYRDNYLLGIPVVGLAALVGTSVFASIASGTTSVPFQIAIGSVSIATAVLASLNTFLSYQHRAETHGQASVRYEALGREVEQVRALIPDGKQADAATLDRIRAEMGTVAAEAPHLNRKLTRMGRRMGERITPGTRVRKGVR